jgi:hypothetical protein
MNYSERKDGDVTFLSYSISVMKKSGRMTYPLAIKNVTWIAAAVYFVCTLCVYCVLALLSTLFSKSLRDKRA